MQCLTKTERDNRDDRLHVRLGGLRGLEGRWHVYWNHGDDLDTGGGRYGGLRVGRRGLVELDVNVLEVREANTTSSCSDSEGCYAQARCVLI